MTWGSIEGEMAKEEARWYDLKLPPVKRTEDIIIIVKIKLN